MSSTPPACPDAIATIRTRAPNAAPRVAIVLGSGLGGLAEAIENATAIPYDDLAGFPEAGVSGHVGRLVLGRLEGVEVAVLQGRAHAYEHGDATVMRAPIEALRGIGVTALILTNAAGSLHADMGPGSLMLIRDHINMSGLNPLIGERGDARFIAMTGAYDANIADALLAAGPMHQGVYAWMLGPSFETPAEIRMMRTLGADAVGMSTVPEVIIARRLRLKAGAVSIITNLGAGLADETLSHAQTKREGARAAERLVAHLRRAMPGIHATAGQG